MNKFSILVAASLISMGVSAETKVGFGYGLRVNQIVPNDGGLLLNIRLNKHLPAHLSHNCFGQQNFLTVPQFAINDNNDMVPAYNENAENAKRAYLFTKTGVSYDIKITFSDACINDVPAITTFGLR